MPVTPHTQSDATQVRISTTQSETRSSDVEEAVNGAISQGAYVTVVKLIGQWLSRVNCLARFWAV